MKPTVDPSAVTHLLIVVCLQVVKTAHLVLAVTHLLTTACLQTVTTATSAIRNSTASPSNMIEENLSNTTVRTLVVVLVARGGRRSPGIGLTSPLIGLVTPLVHIPTRMINIPSRHLRITTLMINIPRLHLHVAPTATFL